MADLQGYVYFSTNGTNVMFGSVCDLTEMPPNVKYLHVDKHIENLNNIKDLLSFRNIRSGDGSYRMFPEEADALFQLIHAIHAIPAIPIFHEEQPEQDFDYNELLRREINEHLIRHTVPSKNGDSTWIVRFMQNGELEFVVRPVNHEQHCSEEKYSGFYSLNHLVWFHHNVVNDIPISGKSNVLKQTYTPGKNDWTECDMQNSEGTDWIRMSTFI